MFLRVRDVLEQSTLLLMAVAQVFQTPALQQAAVAQAVAVRPQKVLTVPVQPVAQAVASEAVPRVAVMQPLSWAAVAGRTATTAHRLETDTGAVVHQQATKTVLQAKTEATRSMVAAVVVRAKETAVQVLVRAALRPMEVQAVMVRKLTA